MCVVLAPGHPSLGSLGFTPDPTTPDRPHTGDQCLASGAGGARRAAGGSPVGQLPASAAEPAAGGGRGCRVSWVWHGGRPHLAGAQPQGRADGRGDAGRRRVQHRRPARHPAPRGAVAAGSAAAGAPGFPLRGPQSGRLPRPFGENGGDPAGPLAKSGTPWRCGSSFSSGPFCLLPCSARPDPNACRARTRPKRGRKCGEAAASRARKRAAACPAKAPSARRSGAAAASATAPSRGPTRTSCSSASGGWVFAPRSR